MPSHSIECCTLAVYQLEKELVFLVLFLWLRYIQLKVQHREEREKERKEKLTVQKDQARRTRHLRRKRILRKRLIPSALLHKTTVRRSVWCNTRNKEYWNAVKRGDLREEWWYVNLRMNRLTFVELCSELRPHLRKRTSRFWLPVPVDQQLVVTLWRLATNLEYRTIAALFGLGISTVCTIVLRTCSVIAEHLLPRYVCMPSEDKLRQIVGEFENLWGFPQVAGAIDGSRMLVLQPKESPSDYYNRKGFYSILVQAVVDSRGYFLNVTIGWPGKVHDSRLLVNSYFYRRAMAGQLLPDRKRVINGVEVPLLILGDSAYPLFPRLQKAFPDTGTLNEQQRHFNYRLSRARMVVKNSFGRLKEHWRCLLKRMDYYNIKNATDVIASCIVLHNICEARGDTCDPGWIYHDDTLATSVSMQATATTQSRAARTIRDALSGYLYNNQ